jgi:bifunctional DNA-binding transcriptional regulator/antitoxin component of YhaV-PrlF toxin-antitoxin module
VLLRKVTASAKGQFTLPADILRKLGGGKGPMELVLVQDGDRVILVPAERAAQAIIDDLEGWDVLSARSLNELWDNEFDEVWNDA